MSTNTCVNSGLFSSTAFKKSFLSWAWKKRRARLVAARTFFASTFSRAYSTSANTHG
jgi:hypothetical protein